MNFAAIYLSGPRWNPQAAYYGAVLSALSYYPVDSWKEPFKAWSGCNSVSETIVADGISPRIVIFTHDEGIGVIVQGTANLRQWIDYMVRHGVSTLASAGGQVFIPFADYFTANFATVDVFGRPGRPTFFCGHSFGAAIAMLFSQRFASQGKPIAGVYLYGCPRIGDSAWADAIQHPHYAHVDVNDTVPYLPPVGFSSIPKPGSNIFYYPLMYGPSNTVALGENRERPNVSSLLFRYGLSAVVAEAVSTGAIAHSANNYVELCHARMKPVGKAVAAPLTLLYNQVVGL